MAPGGGSGSRYLDKDIQNQNEKLKAAQASLNAMNESLSRDKAAPTRAMEAGNKREKAKDAENKLNEERTNLARD
ncbi:hypothetical protein [Klebsiella pneumoniae]|uniref:hypothetical protein n=1 Tax=Klebsiella pneumoniae TaxID=573 RepID=UPI0022B6D6C9|nr:hypothetical protein [Klebsiella pneumoniae]